MRAAMITIVLGLITAAILAGISCFRNRLRAPVVVSPKQISIKTRQWDVKSIFNIHNRDEKTLYSIWLKLAIEDPDVKSDDIKLQTENGEDFFSVNLENISVNFEVVRINGTETKGKRRECVFLILHSLAPNEIKSFMINLKSDTPIDKKQPFRVVLKITGHSDEATQILSQDRKIAFPFKPPENIKVRGFDLLMKKK